MVVLLAAADGARPLHRSCPGPAPSPPTFPLPTQRRQAGKDTHVVACRTGNRVCLTPRGAVQSRSRELSPAKEPSPPRDERGQAEEPADDRGGRLRPEPLVAVEPKPLSINVACALHHSSRGVVEQCAARLGWQVSQTRGSMRDHLYFISLHSELHLVAPLIRGRAGRVGRFPGMLELCGKYSTARMARLYDRLWPGAAAFQPQTWLLPEEASEAMAHLPVTAQTGSPSLIVKPDSGSKGDGIFLCGTQAALEEHVRCHGVAQAYVANPLLLDGLKFDFRLYVLLSRVTPLRAYLCRAGLVRFCTEPYAAPTPDDDFNCCAHLTNYAINMRSEQFAPAADGADGATKRTLETVLHQLEAAHRGKFSAAGFWRQVEAVVAASLATLQLPLQDAYEGLWGSGGSSSKCFHIIGYDLMMDADCRLYLLELNNAPSLYLHEVQFIDPTLSLRQPSSSSHHTTSSAASATPRRDYSGGPCHCMAAPHIHVQSPVDTEVKEAVVGGAFQLLQMEMSGLPPVTEPWGPLADIYTVVDFSRPGRLLPAIFAVNRRILQAYSTFCRGETSRPLPMSTVRRALGMCSVTTSAQLDLALGGIKRSGSVPDFFHGCLQLAAALGRPRRPKPSPPSPEEPPEPPQEPIDVLFDKLLRALCPSLP